MNQNNKKIIDAYRNGDFNERLHMFMQFSELRSDFIAIDLADWNKKIASRKKNNIFNRLLSSENFLTSNEKPDVKPA